MSEHQLYYDAFRTRVAMGEFSHPDPSICECHGGGWFLSQVDTWHKCPAHPNKPHPEDDWQEDEKHFWDWERCDHHVTAWIVAEFEKKQEERRGEYDDGDIPF